MEVEIDFTENPERLMENISKRVEESSLEDGKINAETDDPEFLSKTPGVESYTADREEYPGIGGKPVQEEVYARLESREDAVRCLLATIEGYDLRVLNTDREWDLKQLKKYNPDIKHLKFDEPKEFLGIEKAICDAEGVEKIEIELPDEEDTELIYRRKLT